MRHLHVSFLYYDPKSKYIGGMLQLNCAIYLVRSAEYRSDVIAYISSTPRSINNALLLTKPYSCLVALQGLDNCGIIQNFYLGLLF